MLFDPFIKLTTSCVKLISENLGKLISSESTFWVRVAANEKQF